MDTLGSVGASWTHSGLCGHHGHTRVCVGVMDTLGSVGAS